MLRVGYLFERFPSFVQAFCYREVAELLRQGADVTIFSIRHPANEPSQDWADDVVRRVTYLPDEAELVAEITRAMRRRELPDVAIHAIDEWDRRPDFLRLYQAAYVGLRLQRAGIERVHAHFAGMAARTAYWINHFFGIPFSFTAHANDIFAPRDFVISLSRLIDAARVVVTVSDFAVAHLQQQFPQSSGKIRRVYNGIDLGGFRAARFDSRVPLILSVGRLIEKKGFADLIRACAFLKSASRDFRCQIIGEGPLHDTLSKQIAEAQLADHVHLLGPRMQAEIADRLAATTVFVLPCTTEADGGMDNLPTVIMEAMASGLPVVSTTLAGVPEMVQSGKTGEMVPPGDQAALARAIERIISNPSLARELGQNGRELAAERFSIEANVRALAAILENTR